MKSDKEPEGIIKPVEPVPAVCVSYCVSGSFPHCMFLIVPLTD